MHKYNIRQHMELIVALVREQTISEDTDYILYFPGLLINPTLQVLVRESLHSTWEHVHFGQEEVELDDGTKEAVWFIHLSGKKNIPIREQNNIQSQALDIK